MGGYRQDVKKVVNGAIFEARYDQMVVLKDIEVYSMCEHHMLPFFGKCHVRYIAQDKVLGVSKLARIVDMYARRLQIQERLTEQIAAAIQKETDALGVGVVMECKHLCMMMRGVEKLHSLEIARRVEVIETLHVQFSVFHTQKGHRQAHSGRPCCSSEAKVP